MTPSWFTTWLATNHLDLGWIIGGGLVLFVIFYAFFGPDPKE